MPSDPGWDSKASLVIDSLHEGLIVVDRDLIIRAFNHAAERLTGRSAAERIGRRAEVMSVEDSPIFEVLRTGRPLFNVEQRLQDGRTFLLNFVPIVENGQVTGAIQSFQDITQWKSMERQLVAAKEELDEAFALTLPNTRVERRLRSTPEYCDVYDPQTGLITITEVIPDGTYRHVVNALKVAADLNRQGVFHQVAIDKDTLVQAILFHDLGKVQPRLKVGDRVDPAQVFEPSKLHAARSADMAANFYNVPEEAIWLIRYHHHAEDELPPEFPRHLLPMLRLLQLIDGLSASITRRSGSVRLKADGNQIEIDERNASHPGYNRRWRLCLYTGRTEVLEQYGTVVPFERSTGGQTSGSNSLPAEAGSRTALW
ncbi:MAG: PAS domain-containing protein [Thermaerobacter sp.]